MTPLFVTLLMTIYTFEGAAVHSINVNTMKQCENIGREWASRKPKYMNYLCIMHFEKVKD